MEVRNKCIALKQFINIQTTWVVLIITDRRILLEESKKNWFRLFSGFFFRSAIINGYILYIQGQSDRRNTDIITLIGNYSSKQRSSVVFKMKKFRVPDEARLANGGVHMPPVSSFKRCKFCSTRDKEERVKQMCKICKEPICIFPCWESFHISVSNNHVSFILLIKVTKRFCM